MSFAAQEPQAWVNCEKCIHWETGVDQQPCSDCLTCTLRCGYEEWEIVDGDRPESDEGKDCTGCERDY